MAKEPVKETTPKPAKPKPDIKNPGGPTDKDGKPRESDRFSAKVNDEHSDLSKLLPKEDQSS